MNSIHREVIMPHSEFDLYSTNICHLQKIKRDLLENTPLDLELQFPNFSLHCNRLCARYIYDYLLFPVQLMRNNSIQIDKLKHLLCITKDFEKFFEYMMNLLIADGLLVENNGFLQFNHRSNSVWKNTDLQMIYPMFRGTLALLDHCVSNFTMALSEKIPAIGVLYPDGSPEFMKQTLSDDTAVYTEMPVIKDIAVNLLLSLFKEFSSLKILEIGGGQGLITREILDSISDITTVEYFFTDISRRFVIDMQRHANDKGLNFLKCGQFDITRCPSEQGIQSANYDIILGLDVVHATPNIELTLKNIKSLLKPEGFLCLLETTTSQRWQNLIMGLAKGWWVFNDKWRTSTPLLSPSGWENVINASGYSRSDITTLKNTNSDAALILASR